MAADNTCAWWVQSSFKNVRCVNGGAVPIPAYGRQLKTEMEGNNKEEEVGSFKSTKTLATHEMGLAQAWALANEWCTVG